MSRYFNIAGPCNSKNHYMIDALERGGREMLNLVEQKHYFVIHSARQSGKTTFLLELADKVNADAKYHALYCSLECLQGIAEPKEGIPAIVKKIKHELRKQKMPGGFAEEADYADYTNVLNTTLCDYCSSLEKPFVIFFDESDCLGNGTLISFLRQLRNGFITRSRTPFVHSIAIAGMRNIRDYKAHIREDSATLGSASPFTIITKTFSLSTFSHREITELCLQHTKETGQIFEPQAIDYIFEQTDGQPWLVNAIARECVEEILQNDFTKTIFKDIVEQAIQNIILTRGTHFDSLMERLKEPRVRKVILPLLQGEENVDRESDDFLYVRDLGLIKVDEKTKIITPANPIYAEIMVRAISLNVQSRLFANPEYQTPRYLRDGKIDINFLLKDFQVFWRENSDIIWDELYEKGLREYKEASPHLILQAFLQRVINGGGRIHREMALGKKRVDICLEWQDQKYPIEIKILRNNKSIVDGLAQTFEYMEKCGSSEGWLVVFDRDVEKLWEEKIYTRQEIYKGKNITIVGA